MTTVQEFISRCEKAPAVLRRANADAVRAAALTVTTSLRASLAEATGGSNRLRNVGRRGAKLGVGFDVKGTANPTALIQARGQWQLIEEGTKPHTISPRKRGGRALRSAAARGERGTNRTAVLVPGVGPRASVKHPGTRGKHPWQKGVAAGVPLASTAFAVETEKGFLKAVKG